MENNILPETDILIDAHINLVKPAVIEENAGPRETNNDEKIVNDEDDIVNDDNEEAEGIAYDDDDVAANPQNDDAEKESKNIDADSEVHRQNPKENSF